MVLTDILIYIAMGYLSVAIIEKIVNIRRMLSFKKTEYKPYYNNRSKSYSPITEGAGVVRSRQNPNNKGE